jgi:DNA polymerase V
MRASAKFAPPCEIRWIRYRIAAGFPNPCSEFQEDTLDLAGYMGLGKPSVFAFSVAGASMIGAGIEDGDKVIVDRALTPRHGDIVVAVVDDGYTLKRLFITKGRVELRAENPEFKPIVMQDGQQLEIWGVVAGVLRRYRHS